MSTNQQNKQQTIGETIQGVVETLVEKGGAAVEMVKEWAGVEITDDIEQIKKKATRMNADQVQLKEGMQQELTSNIKEQEPVALKEQYTEQKEVIENAQLLNKEQAERKEEMQQELTKENKATPAFDEKTMMNKVIESFDKTTINDAMDKAKEMWDNTTTILTEKTGEVVERVKEMTGIEIIDDPAKIKANAIKTNPEQARAKQEVQKELLTEQKEEKPIEIPKEHEKYIQQQRKQEMQQELTKENKATPAFDEKTMMNRVIESFDKTTVNDAMDKAKEMWDNTTTILTEKTGEVVERVKEMTGIENSNDPAKIKANAMKSNPEQAKAKHEVQRELLAEQKEEKPIEISKEQAGQIQQHLKQQMQKELTNENQAIPAFDEKPTATEIMKVVMEATTSTISEKSGNAVDKVKEWTGMKDTKESIQQIKDNAVDKNPEQAQAKQQMQKELLNQNSSVTTKNI